MLIITCIWVLARLPVLLLRIFISSTLETGSQEIYVKNRKFIQNSRYL